MRFQFMSIQKSIEKFADEARVAGRILECVYLTDAEYVEWNKEVIGNPSLQHDRLDGVDIMLEKR